MKLEAIMMSAACANSMRVCIMSARLTTLCVLVAVVSMVPHTRAYVVPVGAQHQDTSRMGMSLAQLVAHMRHMQPQGPVQPAGQSPKQSGKTEVNDGPCEAQVGGLRWDLSPMVGHDLLFKQASQAYDFSLAVCGSSSHECGPKQKPVHSALCQHHGLWSYSLITEWKEPVWNLLDHNDARKGIQASFHNGDAVGCGRNRITTVQFVCDSHVTAAEIRSVTEPSKCNYVVSIHSPDVCSGGSNHLGAFGSFLVILLTGFIIYCVVGISYKRTKLGVTDWAESIPNIDFWVTVPGHVKEGALWAKEKLTALASGSGSNAPPGGSDAKYEPVASSEASA